MTTETIRNRIQQNRPLTALQDLLFSRVCINDGQWIVAVDAFGVQLFGIHPRADTRQHAKPHCLALGLPSHAIEVVDEVVDEWEAAAMRFVPQPLVLVHRCQADALPHGTTRTGGVADVGNDNARFLVDLLEQRRADRNIARSAYDGVVRVDAERREKCMHGAAHAFVEPGLAAENLR